MKKKTLYNLLSKVETDEERKIIEGVCFSEEEQKKYQESIEKMFVPKTK